MTDTQTQSESVEVFDKSSRVTHNLYQLLDDLAIIRNAQSEGISRLIEKNGGKCRIREAQLILNSLDAVIKKCNGILDATGKKTSVKIARQSMDASERHKKAEEELLELSMGNKMVNDPFEILKHALILKPKPSVSASASVSANASSPTSTSISTSSQSSSTQSNKARLKSVIAAENFPRRELSSDEKSIIIHMSKDSTFTLPVPSNHFAYRIAEFILMIDQLMMTNPDNKGWKRLTESLNKLHMLKASYIPLKKLYDKYIESGRQAETLPDSSLFIMHRGRKRKIPMEDVTRKCNKSANTSTSSIYTFTETEPPLDDTDEALVALAAAGSKNDTNSKPDMRITAKYARQSVDTTETHTKAEEELLERLISVDID